MSICSLCNILGKEEILYEDDVIFIVSTKFMKGHNKRVMIVSKEHIRNVPMENQQIEKFIEFCKVYFDEEPTFAYCEPTFATIPEHWHRIATDWVGNEDIKQLHYTEHMAILTNKGIE